MTDLQRLVDAGGGFVDLPPGRFELDEPLVIRRAQTLIGSSLPGNNICIGEQFHTHLVGRVEFVGGIGELALCNGGGLFNCQVTGSVMISSPASHVTIQNCHIRNGGIGVDRTRNCTLRYIHTNVSEIVFRGCSNVYLDWIRAHVFSEIQLIDCESVRAHEIAGYRLELSNCVNAYMHGSQFAKGHIANCKRCLIGVDVWTEKPITSKNYKCSIEGRIHSTWEKV